MTLLMLSFSIVWETSSLVFLYLFILWLFYFFIVVGSVGVVCCVVEDLFEIRKCKRHNWKNDVILIRTNRDGCAGTKNGQNPTVAYPITSTHTTVYAHFPLTCYYACSG
jgi:hypothetical protein